MSGGKNVESVFICFKQLDHFGPIHHFWSLLPSRKNKNRLYKLGAGSWSANIVTCSNYNFLKMLLDTYPCLSYTSLIIYALCSLSSCCLTLAIELLSRSFPYSTLS